MEEVDESIHAGLEPSLVLADAAPKVGGIVGGKDLADLVDGDLEIPQPPDRAGDLELLRPVAPVAGEPVDVGGPQQVELVVVPEGADRQPGQSREPPDRDQVARVGRGRVAIHADHPEPSGRWRVKPFCAQRG